MSEDDEFQLCNDGKTNKEYAFNSRTNWFYFKNNGHWVTLRKATDKEIRDAEWHKESMKALEKMAL